MPTNQSDVGAIMDSTLTSGWLELILKVVETADMGPLLVEPAEIMPSVLALLLISERSVAALPNSATPSTPSLAVPPFLQMRVLELCLAPITSVKCAPLGKLESVMSSAVQSPWKVIS